jgi:hypothetical protein
LHCGLPFLAWKRHPFADDFPPRVVLGFHLFPTFERRFLRSSPATLGPDRAYNAPRGDSPLDAPTPSSKNFSMSPMPSRSRRRRRLPYARAIDSFDTSSINGICNSPGIGIRDGRGAIVIKMKYMVVRQLALLRVLTWGTCGSTHSS